MYSIAAMLRPLIRMLRKLGEPVLRAMPSRRARIIRRTAGQMNQGPLDIARQAECLIQAVTRVVVTRTMALLVLCPEWTEVALTHPSSPHALERTGLSIKSPVIQWMENQDIAATRWSELVVLPQFQGMSAQERELLERLESDILLPLRINGALTGILVIGPKISGQPYQREELELLSAVGKTVALNVENARLYAIERARAEELQAISEMKSDYILAISHQLKTPISAVKASAEMLTEGLVETPEVRQRLVNAIARGVDSLDRLVTELTEYGKMQSATLELNKVESNFRSIVTDTCTLVQPLADDKGLRLRVHIPTSLPQAVVDPHRVQQILLNLVTNAIRYTPSGGEISVSIIRDGDLLQTQVRDDGPGIPEDQQRWVFEAFYGASDTGKGSATSGLGLAIAKELTELHGGTIWVESYQGEGSTFSFALPIR